MAADIMTIGGIAVIAVIGIFFLAPALAEAIGGAGAGAVSGGLGAGGGASGAASIPPIDTAAQAGTSVNTEVSDIMGTLETATGTITERIVNAGQTPVHVTEKGTAYIYAGEGYVPAPTGKTSTAGFTGKSEWGQAVTAQPARPDPSKDPFGALEYDVQMAQSGGGGGKESSIVLNETVSSVKDREALGIAIGKAPIGADISALLAKSPTTHTSTDIQTKGWAGSGKDNAATLASTPVKPAAAGTKSPSETTTIVGGKSIVTDSSGKVIASSTNKSRTDSSGKKTQTFTSKGWVGT